MGPLIRYIPFVGLPELHQMEIKTSVLTEKKIIKLGSGMDMFDYSLDYIQCKPTQSVPQRKQPTMKLKQPSLQNLFKYTISSVICVGNGSITN
jgi:hypothetical protein